MLAEHKMTMDTWNDVARTITFGLNEISSARLEKVAAARYKSPEAVAREALCHYLDRYNRTFKIW